MKRAFDIVVASALLVLSLPLVAVAALAVRLGSKGPVFFSHDRCGMEGTSFRCLKFRTMVDGAEHWLENDSDLQQEYRDNGYKLKRSQDPRVTPVGHALRFTHLDELPQLVNVIRGEMSLVGPRPVIEEELEWYGSRKDDLLSVRPGVFGLWTAQGKERVEYPARVEVELAYVENPSFFRDLAILLQNVPVLLSGQVEE